MENVNNEVTGNNIDNCNLYNKCNNFSDGIFSILTKYDFFDKVDSAEESEVRKELYSIMLREIKSGNLVLGPDGEVLSVNAPNGNQSELYKSMIDSGFSEYNALRGWLQTRTSKFRESFGDWEINTERVNVSLSSLARVTGNFLTLKKAKEELGSIIDDLPAVPEGKTRLYRIDNPNIEAKPDGIVSHNDLIGKWFTDNVQTLSNYIRKNQKVDGIRLSYIDITDAQKEERNVSKHSIASQMDVENDNWIIGDNDISKFTDDNGEPLLLLHGTQGEFDEFDKSKIGKLDSGNFGKGFYFTPHKYLADKYAKGGDVLGVIGICKNPYIFSSGQKNVRFRDKMTYRPMGTGREEIIDNDFPFEEEVVAEYNQITGKSVDSVSHDNMEYDEKNLSLALTNVLQRKGYDGLIGRNPISGLNEYIVFEPEQVKSIIDNNGLFQRGAQFRN